MLEDGCPLDAFVTNVLERSGYRQMLIDGKLSAGLKEEYQN